jgi:hypothetical protein
MAVTMTRARRATCRGSFGHGPARVKAAVTSARPRARMSSKVPCTTRWERLCGTRVMDARSSGVCETNVGDELEADHENRHAQDDGASHPRDGGTRDVDGSSEVQQHGRKHRQPGDRRKDVQRTEEQGSEPSVGIDIALRQGRGGPGNRGGSEHHEQKACCGSGDDQTKATAGRARSERPEGQGQETEDELGSPIPEAIRLILAVPALGADPDQAQNRPFRARERSRPGQNPVRESWEGRRRGIARVEVLDLDTRKPVGQEVEVRQELVADVALCADHDFRGGDGSATPGNPPTARRPRGSSSRCPRGRKAFRG